MRVLTPAQVRRRLEEIAPYVMSTGEYARAHGLKRTAGANRVRRGHAEAVMVAGTYLVVREDGPVQAAA